MSRENLIFAGSCLGSFITGYSSSTMSSTLGQPTWYSSMGLVADAASPSYQHTNVVVGGANGAFYGGGALGCWIAAYLSEKIGRVVAFRVAAVVHIVGSILQCAARNQTMFIVARVIAGIALGQTCGSMTTYYAELSVPEKRGWLSGLHALMIEIGGCCAAFVGLGCFYAAGSTPGTFAWRFPISLVALWAVIFFIATFLLPESPRWLIRHGNDEKAFAVLERIRRSRDTDGRIAMTEYLQIQAQANADHSATREHGNWQLFTQPTYRRRLIIAFLLVCSVQSLGILTIFNYGVQLFTQLGVSSAISLVLIAVWLVLQAVSIYVGNMFADKTGRRKSLLIGFGLCGATMTVFSASAAKFEDGGGRAYSIVCIVFIYLISIPFGAFVTNHQFTVVTEIFPNHLRAAASSIAISALFLMQALWLNVGPLALANIRWKYYLVFAFLGYAGAVFVYIFIPETMNIPLEELDMLFNQKVSKRWAEIEGIEDAQKCTVAHHENDDSRHCAESSGPERMVGENASHE